MEKEKCDTTAAQQIAQAACDFGKQTTGHTPKAVSVAFSADPILINRIADLAVERYEKGFDKCGIAETLRRPL